MGFVIEIWEYFSFSFLTWKMNKLPVCVQKENKLYYYYSKSGVITWNLEARTGMILSYERAVVSH